jgi:DNA primase
MKYPPHILEEIKTRLPASTVIGRRVKLQKVGREWKGLSPFNAEKTPSFYVNDQKAFWHDFSSGKSGDIFTFLMETEGVSFPEAVEKLASEAGVDLPKATPEAVEQEKRLKTLYEVMELAARFFEQQLQEPIGKFARDYLVKRGLTQATQREFRMGYAPESRVALMRFLRSQGVEEHQIVAAGLAIRPDEGREIYDRFRDRLIIPIQDLKGRVIAFGGRALKADAQPKYLNSPETELFIKGRTLFNAHRARESAFKVRSMIVVEGYMDAIAVYQAGLSGVVATLGTAFTQEQIEALWRLAPEPVICFDGDRAGRDAAHKALERILPALKVGFSFKFSFLPQGKDPDDVLREEGIDVFKKVIDQALPFWDVLWRSQVEQADLTTPDGQAVLEKSLNDKIQTIADEKVRWRYRKSAQIHLPDLFWRSEKNKFARVRALTAIGVKASHELFEKTSQRLTSLETLFLGLCIEFPDLTRDHQERIVGLSFRGAYTHEDGTVYGHDQFRQHLLNILDDDEVLSAQDIYRRTDPSFFVLMDDLHGRETPLLPMGHRLHKRFQILGCAGVADFMRECFMHFLDMLHLRQMEDELERLKESAHDTMSEDTERYWFETVREVVHLRDVIKARDNELAEQAAQIRNTTGTVQGSAAFAQSLAA